MRVLLVDVQEPVAAPLRKALSQRHEVVSLGGDPRDLEIYRQAAGCDVVVHGLAPGADALARIDAAGRGTWNLLTMTRATRYVQISTMRLFERHDRAWHLDEQFPPLPSTDPDHLAPYLAEVASREILRSRPVEGLVLRLAEVIDADTFDRGPVKPDWLHVEDAVTAVVAAVEAPLPPLPTPRWRCLNIVRGDASSRYPLGAAAARPLSFSPAHRSDEPAPDRRPTPAIPGPPGPVTGLPEPHRVLVLGAAGPLGAATSAELRARGLHLRVSDIGLLTELVSAQDGPRPIRTEPPHEERTLDVTDPTEVSRAAQDMDAIVNCTVIRNDPAEAFRVNMLGAHNVMTAAVEHGIRRVVHTGPSMTLGDHPAGYTDDNGLGSDLPPRPGDNLYFVSKYLGKLAGVDGTRWLLLENVG